LDWANVKVAVGSIRPRILKEPTQMEPLITAAMVAVGSIRPRILKVMMLGRAVDDVLGSCSGLDPTEDTERGN